MDLNVTFALHGTPFGQDFHAEPQDRTFVESHYVGLKSDCPKMTVRLYKSAQGIKCYYNYLITDGVVDSNGRAGGYFALTIGLNVFCSEIYNIYRILDSAFNLVCAGHILKSRAKGWKHLVSRYEEASDTVDRCEKLCYELITQLYESNPACMVPIDGSFSISGSQFAGINPTDTPLDSAISAFKSCGNIAVSDFFPTKLQEQALQEARCKIDATRESCDLKIKEMSISHNAEIKRLQAEKSTALKHLESEYNAKISSARQAIEKNNTLQQTLSERTDNIRQLNTRIESLNKTIDSLKSKVGIGRDINTIREPIARLYLAIEGKNAPAAGKSDIVDTLPIPAWKRVVLNKFTFHAATMAIATAVLILVSLIALGILPGNGHQTSHRTETFNATQTLTPHIIRYIKNAQYDIDSNVPQQQSTESIQDTNMTSAE